MGRGLGRMEKKGIPIPHWQGRSGTKGQQLNLPLEMLIRISDGYGFCHFLRFF